MKKLRAGLVFLALGLCAAVASAQDSGNLLEKLKFSDVATLQSESLVLMRDGVKLSTFVFLPRESKGKRLPVVLIRTPYALEMEPGKDPFARTLFENGYAIVVQHERGLHKSEGEYHFLPETRNDGADTLTWIASQPWSNGKVGTYGCSSSAENQLALSGVKHPAHKAAIARSAGAGIGSYAGNTTRGLFYKGGVPQIGPWAWWYGAYGHRNPEETTVDPFEKNPRGREHLPSAEILDTLNIPNTDFSRFMRLSPADAAWNGTGHLQETDRPRVPTLHVNGWYDVGAQETVQMFEHLQSTPNQYLIMAPTEHCAMEKATETTMVGERPMGDGRYDYQALYLNWFNHWLKGEKNDVLRQPKVTVAVMGAGRWVTADRWPLPGTQSQTYVLSAERGANSLFGDGRLGAGSDSSRPWDELIADPRMPVQSRGGGCCDPDASRDQREVEARNDVLVYSSEPLKTGLSVVGEIGVTLFVSANVKDTDLALKLVDVYPDGRAFNLYDTMLRMRYRDGFTAPKLMADGEVYEVHIKGLVTGNYFAAGHRIRLEVAGSNFPNFERNLNTGGRNDDETQPQVATIRIHHTPERASRIEIPVKLD